MKKVALILSGCGHQDGAEIRESVLCLLELDKQDIWVEIFAPNIEQHDVVDHIKHAATHEKRNVMAEAARIARGNIKPLDTLDISLYDGLVLPGGFGVAKNLSDLASKWENATTLTMLDKIIKQTHTLHKPIAAVCIAPAVVALSLRAESPELTLGNESDLLAKMGLKSIKCNTNSFVYDQHNQLLSTPAYMHDDRLSKVWEGISKMITKFKEIL